MQLLDSLAANAAEVAADRAAAPAYRRRWRHAIEFALVSGVADAMLRAAGRAGAFAWERDAAPKLGRCSEAGRSVGREGGPPLGPGPAGAGLTPAQRHRVEENRLKALSLRAAKLEREAAAAEASAGGADPAESSGSGARDGAD